MSDESSGWESFICVEARQFFINNHAKKNFECMITFARS